MDAKEIGAPLSKLALVDENTSHPDAKGGGDTISLSDFFGDADPDCVSVDETANDVIQRSTDSESMDPPSETSSLKYRAVYFMNFTFLDFANGLLSLLRRGLYLEFLGEKYVNDAVHRKQVDYVFAESIKHWFCGDVFNLALSLYVTTSIGADAGFVKERIFERRHILEKMQRKEVTDSDVAEWKREFKEKTKTDHEHYCKREMVCFDLVTPMFQEMLLKKMPDIKKFMLANPPTHTFFEITEDLQRIQHEVNEWPVFFKGVDGTVIDETYNQDQTNDLVAPQ